MCSLEIYTAGLSLPKTFFCITLNLTILVDSYFNLFNKSYSAHYHLLETILTILTIQHNTKKLLQQR